MKEWLYRALRTFGQAMLGYLTANLLAVVTEADVSNPTGFANTLLGLFAAAVAAGLAAVMNWKKGETTDDK